MQKIFWLDGEMLASGEGRCLMDLVSQYGISGFIYLACN